MVVFFGGGIIEIEADDLGLPRFPVGVPLEAGVAGAAVAVEGHSDGAGVDDEGVVEAADEGLVGVADGEDSRTGGDHLAQVVVGGAGVDADVIGEHGGVDGADFSAVGAEQLLLEGHGFEVGDAAV